MGSYKNRLKTKKYKKVQIRLKGQHNRRNFRIFSPDLIYLNSKFSTRLKKLFLNNLFEKKKLKLLFNFKDISSLKNSLQTESSKNLSILDRSLFYCILLIVGLKIAPIFGWHGLIKFLTLVVLLISLQFEKISFITLIPIVGAVVLGWESADVLATGGEPEGSSSSSSVPPASSAVPEEVDQVQQAPRSEGDVLPSTIRVLREEIRAVLREDVSVLDELSPSPEVRRLREWNSRWREDATRWLEAVDRDEERLEQAARSNSLEFSSSSSSSSVPPASSAVPGELDQSPRSEVLGRRALRAGMSTPPGRRDYPADFDEIDTPERIRRMWERITRRRTR